YRHLRANISFFDYTCFFFYKSCYHLLLHSFPTRRSSDLFYITRKSVNNFRFIEEDTFDLGLMDESFRSSAFIEKQLHRQFTRVRSEEHASELQSHLNLVCRLLLEKKKIINYNIHIIYYEN